MTEEPKIIEKVPAGKIIEKASELPVPDRDDGDKSEAPEVDELEDDDE